MSSEARAHVRRGRVGSFLRSIVARMPMTWTLIGLILLVGIVSGGLWSPFAQSPLWDDLAYGLPAFQAGRWWTPVTGTFLVASPWGYLPLIVSFWGMAYLEMRRGSRVALAYFAGGQLFAVIGTALLVWLAAAAPWDWAWAAREAADLDVGASGGTFAAIAAAISLFVAPWRLRGWLVLLALVVVSMVFWGSIDDLEHLLAVLFVLAIDRPLRPQLASVREQRLIVFVATIVLGVLTVVTSVAPTDGPFGATDAADGGWTSAILNVVVILLVANGLRRGRRWAWVLSILVSVLNLLAAAFIVLVGVLLGWDTYATSPGVTLVLAASVMWAVYFWYLIAVRGAFRARPRRPLGGAPQQPSLDEVKELIRASGGGTLSWMTTWDRNEYLRTSTGIVAYQRVAGVALALADPLGPQEGRAQSVREFIEVSQRSGLVPAIFSASEASRAAVPADWRSLVVADDTIVDLTGLQFTGKRWNSVRTAMNKAAREGVLFRMTRLGDEPWGIQAQVRAISEMWVGDKGLPEMGFTLGSLNEAADPEVRLAMALSPAGDVDGFLSWLPVYGVDGQVDGWTLDLIRRRDGGFGPVMEFLIGSSAQRFSEEGARIMSLSGAPLAHDYPPDAGRIAALSDRLSQTLEPVYGFASLHRFKEKFNPRYETMYLLYPDEADLARIGAGLTRAFLPDATMRQFAGAGLELVTGR